MVFLRIIPKNITESSFLIKTNKRFKEYDYESV